MANKVLMIERAGKAAVLALVWLCWTTINSFDQGLAEIAALAIPEAVRRGFNLTMVAVGHARF